MLTREAGHRSGSDTEFHNHYVTQAQSHDKLAGAVDGLRRWRDAGGDAGSVVTMGFGFRCWQEHVDYLAKVVQGLNR